MIHDFCGMALKDDFLSGNLKEDWGRLTSSHCSFLHEHWPYKTEQLVVHSSCWLVSSVSFLPPSSFHCPCASLLLRVCELPSTVGSHKILPQALLSTLRLVSEGVWELLVSFKIAVLLTHHNTTPMRILMPRCGCREHYFCLVRTASSLFLLPK